MSLSGEWTGVYEYADDPRDPVPFNATLTDVGGVIWGETQEPNTFSPGADKHLTADISGIRTRAELRFRKEYTGRPPGARHPIDYFGHVTADGQRIEGRWQIHVPGVKWGGKFIMNRHPERAKAKTRQAAETLDIDV